MNSHHRVVYRAWARLLAHSKEVVEGHLSKSKPNDTQRLAVARFEDARLTNGHIRRHVVGLPGWRGRGWWWSRLSKGDT